jgi:rod shape-determining protein MreD
VNRRGLVVLGRLALLFVVAVALQTLIVSQISVLGVTADLFLILTIVIAIGRSSLEGALFGFAAGVLADIAYMQPMGVRALVYVLVGYFVGMVVQRFGSIGPWAVFLIAIGSSFSAQLIFAIVQFMLGPKAGLFTILGIQILPEAVLDGLIAIPVFVLLVHLRILPEQHRQPTTPKAAAE